jgi:hypothetical protein
MGRARPLSKRAIGPFMVVMALSCFAFFFFQGGLPILSGSGLAWFRPRRRLGPAQRYISGEAARCHPGPISTPQPYCTHSTLTQMHTQVLLPTPRLIHSPQSRWSRLLSDRSGLREEVPVGPRGKREQLLVVAHVCVNCVEVVMLRTKNQETGRYEKWRDSYRIRCVSRSIEQRGVSHFPSS